MASHPWNLILRFTLELMALAAFSAWGWMNFGWSAAIGVPVIVAGLWGIFAVPGDPSRSGKAPVAIPGWLRLIVELGVFYCAAWALFEIDQITFSIALSVFTTLHYSLSFDRLGWLIRS